MRALSGDRGRAQAAQGTVGGRSSSSEQHWDRLRVARSVYCEGRGCTRVEQSIDYD